MQLKSQRLFLINGGIDVAYVATGFFLKYLAPKYPKNEERLQGYGNSVILQGSFLFVFDLVMYGLHRNLRTDFMQQLSFAPMQEAWGLALSISFKRIRKMIESAHEDPVNRSHRIYWQKTATRPGFPGTPGDMLRS